MPSLFLDAVLFGSFVHPYKRRRTWDEASRHHTIQALVMTKSFLGHFAPRLPHEFTGNKQPFIMPFFKLFETFVPFQFHFCTKLDLEYEGSEFEPVTDIEKEYFADKSIEKKSRLFFLGRFFQLKYFRIVNEYDEQNRFQRLDQQDLNILGDRRVCPMIDLEELVLEYALDWAWGIDGFDLFKNFKTQRAMKKLDVGGFGRSLDNDQLYDTVAMLPVTLRCLHINLGWTMNNERGLELFSVLPECLEELHMGISGGLCAFQFSQEPQEGDDDDDEYEDTTEYQDGILNKMLTPEKAPFFFKNLRYLDLYSNEYIPAREAQFIKHFKRLERLNLEMCTKLVTPEFFRDTLSHCGATLKELDVSQVYAQMNDECLNEICEHLPNLEKLSCKDDRGGLTEVGIAHLEKLSKTLRVLHLGGCQLPSDECIKSIAKLDNLEELRLRDSPKLGPKCMSYLTANKSLAENLRVLDLSQCKNMMTDEAAICLANSFSNLHTLKLNSNDKIETEGFQAIIDKLGKQLRVFDVIGGLSKNINNEVYLLSFFAFRSIAGLCNYNQEYDRH